MQKNELFVELTEKESATVNGAHYYYPCYWGYPVSYYGGGYGYGSGYGSASSTTQTTNVNVVYND
jgi:hypothetical protein